MLFSIVGLFIGYDVNADNLFYQFRVQNYAIIGKECNQKSDDNLWKGKKLCKTFHEIYKPKEKGVFEYSRKLFTSGSFWVEIEAYEMATKPFAIEN